MQIDIHSLETYNRLAHEGAQSAAESLSTLTGIETCVEVTNVSLMAPTDLQYEFVGNEFAGVNIGLSGALSGDAVLVFDERARAAITDVLVPGASDGMEKSSIKEVGNIMTSGFIDGWASHLDATIDITPPQYVEGTGPEVLPSTDDDGQALVFRSRVEAVSEAVDFRICLVPQREALTAVLDGGTEDGIDFEKLEVFNDMTKRGAEQAAANISSMTGIETDVEVNRMSFVPISDVPATVGDQRYIGTVFQYRGTPSGYLVFLFDRQSARAVVDALVPVETDEGWGEMEQSAMEELGNIMTSGFIDGWANVLETSIEHTPPTFVADMGSSIVSPIVGEMARTQDHAFLLDSVINTHEDGVFRCEILSLPDGSELQAALDELLVEQADKLHVEPDEVF